ncbi:MAG: winged helix-turn-helix transcriptional regulator [Rubrivivax sp.]|nr:winged helix-turn-helix transcriptional regulator [Rubrivivax sp.]
MARTRPPSGDWSDPLQALQDEGRLPVERFVSFQINQLSTAFERQWTRVMRDRAGVSLSQWRILAMLDAGPLVFSRLAESIGIDKALMSRSTRDLQALDLIKVGPTPDDARSLTLGLTAKGRRLLARMMPLAIQRQQHLLGALTPEERRSFYSAVDKLKTAAEQWDESASGSP